MVCAFFGVFTSNAQYNSSGSHLSWTPDSLVAHSAGAFVDSGSFYRVRTNLKISRTDTLKIFSDKPILVDSGVHIEIFGVLFLDGGPDKVLISAYDSTKNFRGFSFDSTSASYIKNAIIQFGGGIRILDCDMLIENSVIRKHSRANATAAINLFRANPIIRNNQILENRGSAIAGGANIANAPQIIGNYIYGNNTQNDNRPQVSIGATGAKTLIIKNNSIIGNRSLTMAGGVSVFPLGVANSIVDSNLIVDNRYGMTMIGSNNTSVISNNTIRNNNTQGDPNLGGSGLNFQGDTTNIGMVSNNIISGNLWGVTIQTNARPNLGETGVNAGKNHFSNNSNGGVVYALFNNTPQPIKAQNNRWENFTTAAGVESVITHKADNPAYGEVDYNPFDANRFAYVSPGTGKRLTLDSIVNDISGAVIDSGSFYRVAFNITISATDTLEILKSGTVKLDSAVLVSVDGGVLTIDPRDSLVIPSVVYFTSSIPGKNYKGFTIDGSHGTVIRNASIENGGGIRLLDSDILIEKSAIRNNDRGNATAAINLFRSNPIIRENTIETNMGSAIAGGANIANAPQIINNYIYSNNMQNDNRPQISIGATGTKTLVIKGNLILGNRTLTMVGGVSIFPLGQAQAIVDSNVITDNRYGLTMIGSNNTALISNNTIRNNNSQNDPMLGGSGLNFQGDTTNVATVTGNKISGNLWGVTIQTNARPNLGEVGGNAGENVFSNNGNGGDTIAIFNNTPQRIKAQNNRWEDFTTLAQVEGVIVHQVDDHALGLVEFDPFIGQVTVGIPSVKYTDLRVYPNPTRGVVTLSQFDAQGQAAQLYDVKGSLVRSFTFNTQQLDLGELENGVYMLRMTDNQQVYTARIVIAR